MGVKVRQKVKGRGKPWWVFVHHNGERRSIRVGSRSAAEAVADRIRVRLANGEYEPVKAVPTFGEYCQKFLNGFAEVNLKPSTVKGYRSIYRLYLGVLAPKPLGAITRPMLKDLLLDLRGRLSVATVTRIKALISVVLTHALEDDLIQANPAAKVGRLLAAKKDKKADINPLSRAEASLFLESVAKYYPRYYPFFLCALRTGLRLGELLALEWGDIDFQGGFIEVRRSYWLGHTSTPKSGKARRVDMSRQLSAVLSELRVHRKAEALAKGWKSVPDLVFLNEVGRRIDGTNLRKRVFWKALEKAGLRRVRLHDLRHSFATFLIQQGESLAYVRDQMGHHSIQVTVDNYGHLVPGANREAVDKLDDDFFTYEDQAGCAEGAR